MSTAAPLPLTPPRPNLNHYVGWHDYALNEFRYPMERPSSAREWRRQLSDENRSAFNFARQLHHNTFGPVRTAAFVQLLAAGLEQLGCNEGTDPVRWGTLFMGPAGAGKTELAKLIARTFTAAQLARADISREIAPSLYIPCVHVAVPTMTSLKAFNQAILAFYGAPTNGTKDDMTLRIIELASRCRTELFVIDDVNRVQPRYRDGDELAQHFKTLMQALAATFVFAGTPEAEAVLLERQDESGASEVDQTGGRLVAREVRSLPIGKRDENRKWAEVVKAFERQLILRDHEPNSLLEPTLLSYLHDRTQGYLGSLSELIRGAATRAVKTGEERVSREILEQVTLNHRSETHRPVASVGAGRGA